MEGALAEEGGKDRHGNGKQAKPADKRRSEGVGRGEDGVGDVGRGLKLGHSLAAVKTELPVDRIVTEETAAEGGEKQDRERLSREAAAPHHGETEVPYLAAPQNGEKEERRKKRSGC